MREFLAAEPQKLRRVLRQLKQTLASAAHMNRLMPLLITRLKNDVLSTIEHDAVTTAHTRYRLGIQKTHVNDAACLGEPSTISNLPDTIHVIEAVGHGRRADALVGQQAWHTTLQAWRRRQKQRLPSVLSSDPGPSRLYPHARASIAPAPC